MYLREHYEPTRWRRHSHLEQMQERLAYWRMCLAINDEEMKENALEAHRTRVQAKELTANAVRATADAVRATASAVRQTKEAAWMTAQAASRTAAAAKLMPSGWSASDDEDAMAP